LGSSQKPPPVGWKSIGKEESKEEYTLGKIVFPKREFLKPLISTFGLGSKITPEIR